jgi:two-component system, response regulator YesN
VRFLRWSSRILLSYALVFVIPFLLFVGGSGLLLVRLAESETAASVRESVARARVALDREILKMTAVGRSIARDIRIRYFTDTADSVQVLGLENRLATFVETTLFFTDILYLSEENFTFYGSQSVYSPDTVLRLYFDRGSMTPYRLFQTVTNFAEPGFLPPDQGQDRLFSLYIYPLPPTVDKRAAAVFVIPSDNIARLLALGVERGAMSLLLDPRGSVVYSSSPGQELSAAAPRGQAGSGQSRLLVGGRRHLLTRDTSRETGFTFARLEPVDVLRVTLPWVGVLSAVCVAILLGEAMILRAFFRSNYSPLVALLRDLRDDRTVPARGADEDDVSRLRSTLTSYRDELRHQQVAEDLAATLAGGGDDAGRRAAQTLDGLGFLRANAAYAVALAAREPGAPATALEAAAATIEALARRLGGDALSLPDATAGRRVFVLRASDAAAFDAASREAAPPPGAVFAFGRQDASPGRLPRSYSEAQHALAHAQFYGRPAAFAPDPAADGASVADLYPAVERLAREFGKESCDGAADLLDALLRSIREREMPVAVVRSLQSELAFVFQRENRRAGAAARPGLEAVEPRTWQGFQAWCSDACARLQEAKRSLTRDEGHKRAIRIRDRVDAALESPGFSLAPIMQAEALSRSGLSSLFRRHFGETISAYIGRCRMDRATALLERGLPIKQVVATIGYSDPTSFIRKFKKHTGRTPGEWSLAHRKGGADGVSPRG